MQEKNGCLVYKRKHYTTPPRDLKFKFVVSRVSLRSGRSQMFFKTGAFKNFVIFTGKRMC